MSNSALVETVTFNQSGTTRLTTTKSYDQLNRLASITNAPGSSLPAPGYYYTYNAANQRTRATREDNTYWAYGYDALGQVTSGKKHLADTTPLNGLDYAWTFDDIGNRATATVNGQSATYTANSLNQYTERTVPGVIDVLGSAHADATVTVTFPASGGTIYATTRQDELYYKQVSVTNSSAAQYPALKVTAVLNDAGPNGEDVIAEDTRQAFVAQTPEAFVHDPDGNLTADARWTYTWDGENRLVAMETAAAAVTAGVAKQKLEFGYDGQSRRVAKIVFSWSGSAWVLDAHTLYLYDGWNMIAELDGLASKAAARTYVWGLDLSGSQQGAGGVGGLLFTNSLTPSSETNAVCYDGNGNVIALVDMATGDQSGTYDYNAFGETVAIDGDAAEANPFRFSSKYTDAESGMVYYGFRYYSPKTGRWLSRDPIGEQGGLNLYGMVGNDSLNLVDLLGLEEAYNYRERVSYVEYAREKQRGGRVTLPVGDCRRCYYEGIIAEKDGATAVDVLNTRKRWVRREISMLNVSVVKPDGGDTMTLLQVENIVAEYSWATTKRWKIYQKIICYRFMLSDQVEKGELLRDEVHEGSVSIERRFRTATLPLPPEGIDWSAGRDYPIPDLQKNPDILREIFNNLR